MSDVDDLPEEMRDTLALGRDLIRIDTTNPPGNESAVADLIESRLSSAGFAIERFAHAPGRDSLVARYNPDGADRPLCLCGHIDTVPLGTLPWEHDALGGAIDGGKIWGRGATDMKAGVAAMVTAFERVARSGCRSNMMLLLCASEETGCQGASFVADRIGNAGALLIAEPTNNAVAIGHKGVLWVKLTTIGKAAHGSMPHLGVNAIDLMANAILAIRRIDFGVASHPLLGSPTVNVGTIAGGSAANMVADTCEAVVDIRLTPDLPPEAAMKILQAAVGPDVGLEPLLSLNAVASPADEPWIADVLARAAHIAGAPGAPIAVSYFTDASVLMAALEFPPVAIVGPGDPALAHQIDESCDVNAIWKASQLYEQLAREWVSRLGSVGG